MPSKEEKQRRALLMQRARVEANNAFLIGLPMSLPLFQELFNWLDEALSKSECDDTSHSTEQFAKEHGTPVEPLKVWLGQQGGYCDCEVLANVEEKFGSIL